MKVFHPIETQIEDRSRVVTPTSRVYQVSRAQAQAIAADSLNPWDFMSNAERDRVMVLVSSLRQEALAIAKDNMERCNAMWESRRRQLDAEEAAGSTRIMRCPYVVPKSEWIREIQLVGLYLSTVEARSGPFMETSLENVFEATVEVTNAEEDIPPAMWDRPATPLSQVVIKADPEGTPDPLQDSGLGVQLAEVADKLVDLQRASTPVQISIYDKDSTRCSFGDWINRNQPIIEKHSDSVRRRPIEDSSSDVKFPQPMSDREIADGVEKFIKRARRNQEKKEALEAVCEKEEAERAESLLEYHRRRCIAQAERIARTAIPMEMSSGDQFSPGKGKGKGAGKRPRLEYMP